MKTRDEIVDWMANFLWMNGIGNKAGGRLAVEKIVDTLIARGVLIPLDEKQEDHE